MKRLSIPTNDRNPFDIAVEIVNWLVTLNADPELFCMGDTVVRLMDDDTLQPLNSDRWLHLVSAHCDFMGGKGGQTTVGAPSHSMRMVPTELLPKLPVLDGIVHSPYLDSNGFVIGDEGFNPATKLILRTGVQLPATPVAPDDRELDAAVKLVMDDWLGDFPRAVGSSRANALSLILTLTGRSFFALAPLFAVDASTAGSGKGLFVETVSLVVNGRSPHLLELPADGEEQRKVITTALLEGNQLIVWDESPMIARRTLSRILTGSIYSDRLLGGNKMITVTNSFTQVATGNNIVVVGDLKRRIVPIRMTPDNEHPEDRNDFKHPDLKEWVVAHRPQLLAATFTIWRAWLAAGRPTAGVTMGSFERWAGAVGGALEHAGIEGFLNDTKEWLTDGDPDPGGWPQHLAQVHERFGDASFSVQQVVGAYEHGDIPSLPHMKRDPERPLATALGNAYRTVRDRWIDSYRLEPSRTKDSANGARTYTIRARKTNGPPESAGSPDSPPPGSAGDGARPGRPGPGRQMTMSQDPQVPQLNGLNLARS